MDATMSHCFDEGEMRCLQALLDTLIPADDYPGAWEAGVGDYLMRQLQGDLADLADGYGDFLRCLNAETRALHGGDFCDLSLDARTGLLGKVENGEVATSWTIEPASFFRQIIEHCGEGYYSDPGNGGNRDGIAWQMVGFEVRG